MKQAPLFGTLQMEERKKMMGRTRATTTTSHRKKERDEEIQRFGTNMFVFEFPPEFHLHCLNQDDEGRTLHEQAKDGEDMSDISDSAASSFGSVDEDCLMAFEDALETQRLMQEYASRRSLLPSMEAVDSLHSDSLKDTDEMI
mmetsp:Transcript_4188/g.7452  ORF Transcript_4188/g.7452 Transcript_4188/m.7452 type:complete len:143 (-) Transcript_4188:101-529(-)